MRNDISATAQLFIWIQ